MRKVVWGLLLLLAIIHQDVWFWDDPTLVFGFMPMGLVFHVAISIASCVVWGLAVHYCWPDLMEDGVSQVHEGSLPS
jgi:hypothetical protein